MIAVEEQEKLNRYLAEEVRCQDEAGRKTGRNLIAIRPYSWNRLPAEENRRQ